MKKIYLLIILTADVRFEVLDLEVAQLTYILSTQGVVGSTLKQSTLF